MLGFCWLLCSWTHLESAAASSLSSLQIFSGATCDLWASVGHNCQHLPWSLCQGESPQFCTSLGFWPCSSALKAYKVSKIVADSQVPEKQLEKYSINGKKVVKPINCKYIHSILGILKVWSNWNVLYYFVGGIITCFTNDNFS